MRSLTPIWPFRDQRAHIHKVRTHLPRLTDYSPRFSGFQLLITPRIKPRDEGSAKVSRIAWSRWNTPLKFAVVVPMIRQALRSQVLPLHHRNDISLPVLEHKKMGCKLVKTLRGMQQGSRRCLILVVDFLPHFAAWACQ